MEFLTCFSPQQFRFLIRLFAIFSYMKSINSPGSISRYHHHYQQSEPTARNHLKYLSPSLSLSVSPNQFIYLSIDLSLSPSHYQSIYHSFPFNIWSNPPSHFIGPLDSIWCPHRASACWSLITVVFMCRIPRENVICEFLSIFPGSLDRFGGVLVV